MAAVLSLADTTELLIRMRRFVGWIDSSELSANVWHEVIGPEIPNLEIALAGLAEMVREEHDPRRFTAAALLDHVADEVRRRNDAADRAHLEARAIARRPLALEQLGVTAEEYDSDEVVRYRVDTVRLGDDEEAALAPPPEHIPVPPSRAMRWDVQDWMLR